MRILGLPGRLPSTARSVASLLALVAIAGDIVSMQSYGFWAGDFTNPDVEPEAVVAGAHGADLVIALSIGVLVAMAARSRHDLKPRAAVFIGSPLGRLAREGRVELLGEQASAMPTLFLQHADDPTGSFADLRHALPATADVLQPLGVGHDYDDAPGLARLILDWLGR